MFEYRIVLFDANDKEYRWLSIELEDTTYLCSTMGSNSLYTVPKAGSCFSTYERAKDNFDHQTQYHTAEVRKNSYIDGFNGSQWKTVMYGGGPNIITIIDRLSEIRL